ncbi:hypothetical protein [Winogradskyella sp. MIT101101]|uniref:hypothetical protein n=1 Tax=Winogradskyella sp. MIT101101 TaxID=3098297 RepID=UPI00399A9B95
MKNSVLLLFLALLFCSCNKDSTSGIEINGYVKNSEQEYISLNYAPRLRGNLNFDNFKTIGSYIDSNGSFSFHSDKITDGANYTLEFKNKRIPLVLFGNDDVKLDFDIDSPQTSLFATGNGAGKINTLNLTQFGYDNFDLEIKKNLDEFNNHILNIISEQKRLLDAIYFKKTSEKIILSAQNKAEIQRIIKNSPLTKKEYNFLLDRITFQKYSLITSFLSKIANNKSLDSSQIDFDNDVFKYFDIKEYSKLDNINDWHLTNDLESILQIEYLRYLKKQKRIKITYGNWNKFFSDSQYTNWVATYLKSNFNEDIYNKYFADLSSWLMTLGHDYKTFYGKIDTINQPNKYFLKLNAFEDLLNNGLNNEDYGLNQNNLNLNQTKFDSLLESYKNKPLLIVFWSAQFAGASIINNIQAIKLFEDANKEKINLIYVCIDKEVNKKLWAARIIDNSWKSKHYFLPIEGNDTILDKFSNKKISEFCSGGATYAFIDKNGKINNEIEFPFHKSIQEIEKNN